MSIFYEPGKELEFSKLTQELSGSSNHTKVDILGYKVLSGLSSKDMSREGKVKKSCFKKSCFKNLVTKILVQKTCFKNLGSIQKQRQFINFGVATNDWFFAFLQNI